MNYKLTILGCYFSYDLFSEAAVLVEDILKNNLEELDNDNLENLNYIKRNLKLGKGFDLTNNWFTLWFYNFNKLLKKQTVLKKKFKAYNYKRVFALEDYEYNTLRNT